MLDVSNISIYSNLTILMPEKDILQIGDRRMIEVPNEAAVTLI